MLSIRMDRYIYICNSSRRMRSLSLPLGPTTTCNDSPPAQHQITPQHHEVQTLEHRGIFTREVRTHPTLSQTHRFSISRQTVHAQIMTNRSPASISSSSIISAM